MSTNTVVFKTTPEGLDLKLDVYSPSGDNTATAAPVIVWFHIGGLVLGDTKSAFPSWLLERTREAGWTLTAAEFRLAPDASIEQVHEDIKDVWSYIHEGLNGELKAKNLPSVDTTKSFIVGSSVGGYLGLQIGHLYNPKPRAIVSLYGYTWASKEFFRTPHRPDEVFWGKFPLGYTLEHEESLKAILNQANNARLGKQGAKQSPGCALMEPPRTFLLGYLLLKGTYFETVFGRPDISETGPDSYLWPHLNFTADFPPTFLAHGTADSVIPSSESVVIADALKKAGAVHELVILEGREHGFDVLEADSEEVRETNNKSWAFLQKYA